MLNAYAYTKDEENADTRMTQLNITGIMDWGSSVDFPEFFLRPESLKIHLNNIKQQHNKNNYYAYSYFNIISIIRGLFLV